MSEFNHRLAIQVLENKRQEYKHIIFEGRFKYHDPEHEIQQYERMVERLTYSITTLALLQEQDDNTLQPEVVAAVLDKEIVISPYTLSPEEQEAVDARFDHLRKSKDKPSKS